MAPLSLCSSQQLGKGGRHGIGQEPHPRAAIVVAAINPHVLRLVVAEIAVAIVRPALGVDHPVEVQRGHPTAGHDPYGGLIQHSHSVGRGTTPGGGGVGAGLLRRHIGDATAQAARLALRGPTSPIAAVGRLRPLQGRLVTQRDGDGSQAVVVLGVLQ